MKRTILKLIRSLGYEIGRKDMIERAMVSYTDRYLDMFKYYQPRVSSTHGQDWLPVVSPVTTDQLALLDLAGRDLTHDKAADHPQFGAYMLDERTYNANHPLYDKILARNVPDHFYNIATKTDRTASSLTNPLLEPLMQARRASMARDDRKRTGSFMAPILDATIPELDGDADYQDFRGKLAELDAFIAGMNARYPGTYFPGSVSFEDGRFLYYLIRQARPKVVVQTGVSNGVSCAFIALALKHNGQGGKLYAVDLPHIYDPADDRFHQNVVYGVLIPHGKQSGWLVPDRLKASFECWEGDARDVLPKLFEHAGPTDIFYHDSDHTYDHMWFEFETALPYLPPHGLILADDIAWSSVTWDYARHLGCYAFNHGGTLGVIFL